MQGRYVRLEPLGHHHIPELWEAHEGNGEVWVTALSGPPEALPRLVLGLPAASRLTVDAPETLVAPLLAHGFDAPGPDDLYVLLEKRLSPGAGG